jgi:hypothetical protein
MTSPVSLDRRLAGAAQQLLLARLSGAERAPASHRDVVHEQDAVDATLLLLAAIQEQMQNRGLRQEVGSRMIALLMVIRDYVRPLPSGIAADGSDLLTSDIAEMVQVVRAARASVVRTSATE